MDQSRRTLRFARGTLELDHPAKAVLYTRVEGHMDAALARAIVGAGNEIMREDGHLLALHDWETMTSYDSEARHILTAWGKDIERSVDGVHILFRSKLVAMGVSVATLVLGGMIHPHSTRASFLTARTSALAPSSRRPRGMPGS